jgi:hypothetical protein
VFASGRAGGRRPGGGSNAPQALTPFAGLVCAGGHTEARRQQCSPQQVALCSVQSRGSSVGVGVGQSFCSCAVEGAAHAGSQDCVLMLLQQVQVRMLCCNLYKLATPV